MTGDESRLREGLLQGVDLDGLLAEIALLATADPRDTAALMDAHHRLAEYLREHPEAALELAELVPGMDPRVADVVLGAAGAAGTPPAQELLSGVLSDGGLSDPLRQSSLDAMFQLAHPIPAAGAAVTGVLEDVSPDRDLWANGLLTLGALSSMDSASGADPAAGVEELIALEQRALAAGRIVHWLHALGNTSDPRAVAAAAPYLESPGPDVRSAAAEACVASRTGRRRASSASVR